MVQQIEQFISYFGTQKNVSDSTLNSYKRDLLQMAKYLEQEGITELNKVTPTSLQNYLWYMEQRGRAVATISRSITSLKSFFFYCQMIGEIATNPAYALKARPVVRKIPEILTVEEVDRLLNQPDLTTKKGIRDKAMMEVLYATGIRVTELVNLKKEDVNMEMEYITCKNGKKQRIIPFGREAKKILIRFFQLEHTYEEDSTPWLFTNYTGGKMSRQGFWKIIKAYAKKANITIDITPHTIRHSFAAHLLANGAALEDVKEMLGHADITTTQFYLNVNRHEIVKTYYAHPRR